MTDAEGKEAWDWRTGGEDREPWARGKSKMLDFTDTIHVYYCYFDYSN